MSSDTELVIRSRILEVPVTDGALEEDGVEEALLRKCSLLATSFTS